jgi:hypothetical protein
MPDNFQLWDDESTRTLILFLYLWTLVMAGALTMRRVLEWFV